MVRVNLVKPGCLTDQHLTSEYNEILMLIGYISSYPALDDIPSQYVLGKGHMKFFKDKALYLKKRHESLKKEMKRRGFIARKTINLKGFSRKQLNDYKVKWSDLKVIKKRLISRIRSNPGFYRYYGKKRSVGFLVGLVKR